jgi:hypothetical protein
LPASYPVGSMLAPLVWGSSCQAINASMPQSSLYPLNGVTYPWRSLPTGATHRATALYPVGPLVPEP